MFSWFKKKNKIEKTETFDVYKPNERMIYVYWDGEKEIKSDPLTLYKRVMDSGPEMSVNLKVSSSPSKDASVHHDCLVKKVREIFKLKSLDDGGLTEMEAIGLLDHFLSYCAAIKKNSSQSAMLSNPTVDSTNSSPENQPISNSSDSGYVNNEVSTEKQEQSPMEQESP